MSFPLMLFISGNLHKTSRTRKKAIVENAQQKHDEKVSAFFVSVSELLCTIIASKARGIVYERLEVLGKGLINEVNQSIRIDKMSLQTGDVLAVAESGSRCLGFLPMCYKYLVGFA